MNNIVKKDNSDSSVDELEAGNQLSAHYNRSGRR